MATSLQTPVTGSLPLAALHAGRAPLGREQTREATSGPNASIDIATCMSVRQAIVGIHFPSPAVRM